MEQSFPVYNDAHRFLSQLCSEKESCKEYTIKKGRRRYSGEYISRHQSRNLSTALEARKWGRSLNYANLDQTQSHKYPNATLSRGKSSRSFSITSGIWSSTFSQEARWNILFKLKFQALHSLEYSLLLHLGSSQKEIPVQWEREQFTPCFFWATQCCCIYRENNFTGRAPEELRNKCGRNVANFLSDTSESSAH